MEALLLTYISELQEFIAMLKKNRDECFETIYTTPPAEISDERHKMLKNMIKLSTQDLHIAGNELSRLQNQLIDLQERLLCG
jgi:hypothetical protein